MSRAAGFSPSQLVLRRLTRVPGSELANVAEGRSDEFWRQAAISAAARKAFADRDVGGRTARAVPREAAPLAGEYQVGDV
eukprot:7403523-Pyramimonas_sp.AAC.1